MDSPAPASPLNRWVVHVHEPAFGYFWFFEEKLTVVTQTTIPHGTLAAVDPFLLLMDAVVVRAGKRLAAGESLQIVHDWRSMQGYDAAARLRLAERIRSRPKGYVRGTILVVSAGGLWRMALSVIDLVFAFLRVPAPSITTDVEQALAGVGTLPTAQRPAWVPRIVSR
jgi:hypothetical protein